MDLILIYPEPCSIYLRGTTGLWNVGFRVWRSGLLFICADGLAMVVSHNQQSFCSCRFGFSASGLGSRVRV